MDPGDEEELKKINLHRIGLVRTTRCYNSEFNNFILLFFFPFFSSSSSHIGPAQSLLQPAWPMHTTATTASTSSSTVAASSSPFLSPKNNCTTTDIPSANSCWVGGLLPPEILQPGTHGNHLQRGRRRGRGGSNHSADGDDEEKENNRRFNEAAHKLRNDLPLMLLQPVALYVFSTTSTSSRGRILFVGVVENVGNADGLDGADPISTPLSLSTHTTHTHINHQCMLTKLWAFQPPTYV